MNWTTRFQRSARISAAGAVLAYGSLGGFSASAQSVQEQVLPNTGQTITPLAPKDSRFQPLNPGLAGNSQYLAGQAVSTVVSPDKKTLLVLTSGYNLLNDPQGNQINADSNEYVFVFDISSKLPVQKQVVQVPNTYAGIAFDPTTSNTFYVAGGQDDDIHIYDAAGGKWAERGRAPSSWDTRLVWAWRISPPLPGVALTADGTKMMVANYYNDSVTLLQKNGPTFTAVGEVDLRPGKLDPANAKGVPGGEYPFWVAISGNTAYVSSLRDREIVVLSIAGQPTVINRIKVKGQPNRMVLDSKGATLYVAEDETDTVDAIDTASGTLVSTTRVGAPNGLLPAATAKYNGHNTNSVTISPDDSTLYVTNGNTNSVAIVQLSGLEGPQVTGLVPTGWYPTSASTSGDGTYLYVVNAKSPTGPNPGNCHGLTAAQTAACAGTNQYNLQLIKAGLQTLPVPKAVQLQKLTSQVATNNHFERKLSIDQQAKIAFLQSKIKHVIYIVRENRTYDQILGDLDRGNGEPSIAEFGGDTTPNQHNLAKTFVDLDSFFDRSEVSMDGWPWTTSARAPDVVEKQTWTNYAGRGLSYDSEGTNRNINVSYPTLAGRLAANPLTPNDPDLLPGTTDTAAPDGPSDNVNAGYLWNGALRAGLSIRNYGFFIDLTRYSLPPAAAAYSVPVLRNPFASKTQVAYAANAALRPYTDIYFRGFDNNLPDYYRYQEWLREFNANYANGGLPSLSLVRFMHDHTGSFGTALDGVNTPELQVADNDYAVGLLIQTIASSQYKNDTLVFVIEDDSQDGPDHVDSHRSVAYVAGPYVKQGAVISTSYNTVDFVRTIEELLGIKPLNLNDAIATPMLNIFDETLKPWTFSATPSPLLAGTSLPIPKAAFAGMRMAKPTHNANYWARATKGMDFSAEDRIDFAQYNQVLWKGMMGKKPYPGAKGEPDDDEKVERSSGSK